MPPEPVAIDWLVVGLARLEVDGHTAAVPALREALTAGRGDTFKPEEFHLPGFQTAAANLLWDHVNLRKFALAHVTTTREFGALTMLPVALNTLAHLLVHEGDLDGAESALAEAKQILAATGSTLSIFTTDVANLAALRGDDGTTVLIDDQIATARALGLDGALPSGLWARAAFNNGGGQYEQALAAATEALQHPWGKGEHIYLPELIEAAARCGRPEAAAATRRQLTQAAEACGTDWALGIERRCEALFADGPLAEDLYREAIDRLARTPIRPDLAAHTCSTGSGSGVRTDTLQHREHLRTAYEMFTSMGMRAFAERARNELLATGETVRKRTPDSFDELTPQEALIARLAADGCTNAEIGAQLFISPRTVEWHLRKVFTKVNVTSRRDLRMALPRQVRRGLRAVGASVAR